MCTPSTVTGGVSRATVSCGPVASFSTKAGFYPGITTKVINKTMDRRDLDRPDTRSIVREVNALAAELERRDLRASTWYGSLELPQPWEWEQVNRGYGYEPLDGAADDARWPWFLYWEIAWLALNTEFVRGQRVLDLGGSSSLFSYFLAARGLSVVAVDLDPELVSNGNRTASHLEWDLENVVMDIRRLDLPGQFDHVTSVCVYEHVPVSDRIEVSTQIRQLLKEGGTFSITFDYGNPSRRARLSSSEDVEKQVIEPSGLAVRGNRSFHDNRERYLLHPFFHPTAYRHGWKLDGLRRRHFGLRDLARVKRRNDYTFGALFLERSDL